MVDLGGEIDRADRPRLPLVVEASSTTITGSSGSAGDFATREEERGGRPLLDLETLEAAETRSPEAISPVVTSVAVVSTTGIEGTGSAEAISPVATSAAVVSAAGIEATGSAESAERG